MTKIVNTTLVERVQRLFKDVELANYTFIVREAHGGVVLYAEYYEEDVYTRIRELQQTRKWVLSPAMTDSEIIQTCFKCAHTSFEHRVREGFLFKGARIFGPHFDLWDLVKLCRSGRENAGGRK